MQNLNANKLKKFIGEKIKHYRKKRGLSQAELAELINIEVKSLSRIESGHNYPQCENLIAIARALSVSPWQFYFFDEQKNLELMKKEITASLNTDETKIPKLYQYLKIIE